MCSLLLLVNRQFFSPFTNISHLTKHISTSKICNFLKMENMMPSEAVRGMKELDKKLFEKPIQITYLALKDVKLHVILPVVKKYLLRITRLKPIQHVGKSEINILLNPSVIKDWSSFPIEVQNSLQEMSVEESNLKKMAYVINYDNFTAEDIFKFVLPTEHEGMSSFTQVGHIVHINLRERLLPYKKIIAEVLYDKVSGCKSVVNKVDEIDNTYRNFKMEVLKGENDMLTVVKENNCTFKFDFSTVYWNSRLCTEHERIVKKLEQSDILFDVFAGVGPFSIPAAKKKCYVYANDLNPESYKWLNHNVTLNKINQSYIKSFNKDGKDFIKQDIKELLPEYLKNDQTVYIIMNLPAMAVQFLRYFVKLYEEDELPKFTKAPIIFVYCFAKGKDFLNITRHLVIENFGFDASDKIKDLFRVRSVSSFKEMMRVTIKLDRDILVGNILSNKRKLIRGSESSEPVSKRYNVIDNNNGQKQEEN